MKIKKSLKAKNPLKGKVKDSKLVEGIKKTARDLLLPDPNVYPPDRDRDIPRPAPQPNRINTIPYRHEGPFRSTAHVLASAIDNSFSEINKHLLKRYRIACHDDVRDQSVVYYSVDYTDISRKIRKKDIIEKGPEEMLRLVLNAVKGIVDDINYKRELEAEEKYLEDSRNYSYPNYTGVSGTFTSTTGTNTIVSGCVFINSKDDYGFDVRDQIDVTEQGGAPIYIDGYPIMDENYSVIIESRTTLDNKETVTLTSKTYPDIKVTIDDFKNTTEEEIIGKKEHFKVLVDERAFKDQNTTKHLGPR